MIDASDNPEPASEGTSRHIPWGPWLRYEQGSLLPSFEDGQGVENEVRQEAGPEVLKAGGDYTKKKGSILHGNNSTREKMKGVFGRYFRGLVR